MGAIKSNRLFTGVQGPVPDSAIISRRTDTQQWPVLTFPLWAYCSESVYACVFSLQDLVAGWAQCLARHSKCAREPFLSNRRSISPLGPSAGLTVLSLLVSYSAPGSHIGIISMLLRKSLCREPWSLPWMVGEAPWLSLALVSSPISIKEARPRLLDHTLCMTAVLNTGTAQHTCTYSERSLGVRCWAVAQAGASLGHWEQTFRGHGWSGWETCPSGKSQMVFVSISKNFIRSCF